MGSFRALARRVTESGSGTDQEVRDMRMLVALAILATCGSSAAAQSTAPVQKCPTARMTLLGALVGFGVGVAVASPFGAPLGGNVFEDTSGGEQKMWLTVGGLTAAGAIAGHLLAQRCAAPRSPHARPVVLTKAEVQRLARTFGVQGVAGAVRDDRARHEGSSAGRGAAIRALV